MALKLAEEQAQREEDERKEDEATNPMKVSEYVEAHHLPACSRMLHSHAVCSTDSCYLPIAEWITSFLMSKDNK